MLEAIFTVQVFHMLRKIWRKFWQLYLEPSSPQNLLKSNDGNWPNLTGTKRIWLEKTRPCIQGYTLSNLGHNVVHGKELAGSTKSNRDDSLEVSNSLNI